MHGRKQERPRSSMPEDRGRRKSLLFMLTLIADQVQLMIQRVDATSSFPERVWSLRQTGKVS